MICRKSDLNSAEKTADCLKNGGVVIIPTDTVYGFSSIVAKKTESKIRLIKGRSETKPFIVLVANPEDILKYTNDKIPDEIFKLWPGALTVIVNNIDGGTTAFRCPNDAWLRKVITLCESPIYSTSANRANCPPIQNIEILVREFEKEVDLIINDGDKISAKPSTLISIENGNIQILRQGDVIL